MSRKAVTSIVLVVLALFCSSILLAQPPATPEEQAEMMKKYQEMAQPGPEHMKLAELTGNWTYTVKMWMSPAETNPMETEGKGEAKMIIGGRFLQLNNSGSFMGMPFEGMSIIGFDRRGKEYTTVGFDNMGTYWVSAKGTVDTTSGSIVMYGKDEDKAMGFTQEYKFIFDLKSKDNFVFSVVFTDPIMSQGTDNFKIMEINYNRAK